MITSEQAMRAIAAAEQKAQELNIKISTAVVDDHGMLIAFSRMDNALLTTPSFSQGKAFTSALLGMPSEGPAAYAGEGKPYFGLNTVFSGEFVLIAGGVPVMQDGKVVGAVGVGGSLDVSQDAECAKAAVSAITNG